MVESINSILESTKEKAKNLKQEIYNILKDNKEYNFEAKIKEFTDLILDDISKLFNDGLISYSEFDLIKKNILKSLDEVLSEINKTLSNIYEDIPEDENIFPQEFNQKIKEQNEKTHQNKLKP